MINQDDRQVGTGFDDPALRATLDAMKDEPGAYDRLEFGLVGMLLDGTVVAYNKREAEFAGVDPAHAIGLNFFDDVAPCTNNYLVFGRFDESSELDEIIDYVFTVRMHPLRVRLRLLKDEHAGRQYLAVAW
jgi:photoactive yellow protein